jgi:hypothetical protein
MLKNRLKIQTTKEIIWMKERPYYHLYHNFKMKTQLMKFDHLTILNKHLTFLNFYFLSFIQAN